MCHPFLVQNQKSVLPNRCQLLITKSGVAIIDLFNSPTSKNEPFN
jgi:hypothetical protein